MTSAPYGSDILPLVPERTGIVRRFAADDIPQVARLHRVAFRLDRAPALEAYREYFTRVFLENPAGAGPLPSLVYQESDGRLAGFIGIVPRRMVVDGRPVQAVVSSQFIVDPSSRAGLVALRLAKTYLEGPQDLSIADEANDVSRRIWEGLGGTTAMLLSLYWTRPLRPARLALSWLRRRPGFGLLAAAARPAAAPADALASRWARSPLRLRRPLVFTEELSAQTVVEQAQGWHGSGPLRVEYDARTFQWLLDRVAARSAGGRALNAVLRNGRAILGWYVCHLDRHGLAEVAQLEATPASVPDVLDHLFYHAWRQGAVAVTGRLDPRFVQALSDRQCVFDRRGPWVLVKARAPEIVQAFHAGLARLSRLDGEWSLRFHPDSEAHAGEGRS